jgi:hypothetical protein
MLEKCGGSLVEKNTYHKVHREHRKKHNENLDLPLCPLCSLWLSRLFQKDCSCRR